MEDFVEDVVGKAMRGMGLSAEVLEFLSGVPEGKIAQILGGDGEEEPLLQIAPPLGLDGHSLVRQSRGETVPGPIEVEGLRQVSTEYEEMVVNAYVLWDPANREAAIIDTGADPSPLIAVVEELELTPKLLLLTHTHRDHVMGRQDLLARFPEMKGWVHGKEPCSGVARFEMGASFSLGGLGIETRSTWGHSPAGTSYVVSGLERPVALVGDALFASSMGGGMVDYQAALSTNREALFSLSDDTVVCPGHGPMTSIGEEKANNPFFPEYKS